MLSKGGCMGYNRSNKVHQMVSWAPHEHARVMEAFPSWRGHPENIARKKETEIASLNKDRLNATLSDLKEQSKVLDWKEDPDTAVANANSKNYLIYFSHGNFAEQMAFSAFLTDQLKLRGLLVTGKLERWQERLLNNFSKEAVYFLE